MLQFFRRIRQNLIAENKFSRYLFYAVGEILLVVVGILIALQINNWNENNKNHELQLKYIEGIISDLEYDIRAYNIGIDDLDEHRNSANALLTCYKESSTLPKEELIEHFANVSLLARFSHRNTVMDDMKSAGRLNIISSDSIRQQIIAYYTLASGIIESNEKNNDWILNYIIGSRIYTELFDFNSTVVGSKKIPPIMKSVEVNIFSGLPLLEETDNPDRANIINLLTAKNYLEGINKLNGTQGRESAVELKSNLEAYIEEIGDN